LGKKPFDPVAPTPTVTDRPRRGVFLPVAKWTTAGLAVVGLALGITFNRLAASKASDLENAVRTDCPPDPKDPSKLSDCGGNPDMNAPKVSYSKTHYDIQQSYKQNNTISIATFVVGGVMAATSIVLFVVDRGKPERRPRPGERVVVAPVVGTGTYGVAGGVTF
jgi:hypothetical protein